MRSSSEEFANGIIHGHRVALKCELYDPRTDSVLDEPTVVSGSVTVDETRSTRRQCSLTIEDPTGFYVPDAATSYLQPYAGYYFRLYRGIVKRDGTKELMPLGVFAPYKPKITDKGDTLSISISGYDRSKLISRTRWTQPYTIRSGVNTAVAVRDAMETRMPGLRYNLHPTQATTPTTTFGNDTQNDPWKDIQSLATSDGMEVFFSAEDIVTMRDTPDPDDTPVSHTFIDNENCTVLQFDRENDASKMYTEVVVTSESSNPGLPGAGQGDDQDNGDPIRVVVQREDTDLHIPYFFNSPLMKTVDQARKAGESLLRRVGKAEYGVTLTCVPDPRLEVGDVVRVVRPLSKLNDTFVVSKITMPMDAESSMTVDTEKRRMK